MQQKRLVQIQANPQNKILENEDSDTSCKAYSFYLLSFKDPVKTALCLLSSDSSLVSNKIVLRCAAKESPQKPMSY